MVIKGGLPKMLMANQSAYKSSAVLIMTTLLEEIQFLRKSLNDLGKEAVDLTNPQVLRISQLLDEKLNCYDQLKYKGSFSQEC
jgi:hypothetical protein